MSSLASWLRGEWSRLRGLRSGAARKARYEDEAVFHVDMLTERNIRRGMTAAEARRRALVEFGGVDRFGEAARDEYRPRVVEEVWRDVRLAIRNLARIPTFTAAAILTLALGIGATTVVFSIVDHVVLRPLPYEDADRLVVVREVIEEIRSDIPSLGARAAHYLYWREQCEVCDDVAVVRAATVVWRGDGEPVRVPTVRVSANLFPLLGVQPAQGRLFLEEEDAPGRSDAVMVSHAFWLRHLGGDPAVVGRTLRIGSTDRIVAGVLPVNFRLPKGDELGANVAMPEDPGFFIPIAFTEAQISGGGQWDYTVIARLRPGVSAAQAERHFTAMQESLAAGWPEPITLSAVAIPMREQVVGGSGRGLLLLLAAVAAVLLLVCVNLANLLLARNAARARESAVRAALGAGRLRLVREAMTESVILAAAAGAVGVVLSWWGLQLLLQLAPADMPRLHEVRLDLRVGGVAMLLALVTGVFFGALPARRSASADPAEALKAGGRTRGDGRNAVRGRSLLIATQVGMTGILLVAAGLFLTSFVHVLGIDKGFTPDRVLAVDVLIPATEFSSVQEMHAIYQRMLQEVAQVPGVEIAAATSKLPLEGVTWSDGMVEAGDARSTLEWVVTNFHTVTSDYFRTLGIPLHAGRPFTEAERGTNVVVLSERAASAVWPGEPAVAALGRRVQLGGHFAAEVIGIAADITATGLEAERQAIAYVPDWSPVSYYNTASVAVRTTADPTAALSGVRSALRSAAPGVVVSNERTMDRLVSDAAAARRFQLSLLLVFAATALLTACIGIYGVIAHSLVRRRGEIGVRMALGAHRARIHRLVVGEGLRAAAVGLACGIAVVLAAGRLVESLLYDVRPADPMVLAAVVALLAAVAALASYIPARSATAHDPSAALRQD